ncbi:MAG: Gfo/Idh/MocA family protein [Anaerolineales bacterium]
MRFGFVGLGFATRCLHLPAVRALPNGVGVGGVDSDPGRQAEWARLDAGPVFSSLPELLDRGKPDVVVIATPPDSHASLCLTALDAGVDVVCEKPFVETRAQAEEVLAAARRAGRWVAVNHEFRYMPIFAAVAREVGRPGVGRAVFLHCTQFMDLAPWEEKVAWRAAMPDRSLFEGGVHLIDLLHLIAGRLPRRVSAMASSGLDPEKHADAIHLVTLDYGDGLLGQITIDRLCRAGTRYADLQVDCEQASLRASYGGRAYLQVGAKRGERPGVRLDIGLEGLAWAERGLRREVLARNPRRATPRATQALYAAACAAFERNQEPPTSARIAADTLLVVEAAYRSAKSGVQVGLVPA